MVRDLLDFEILSSNCHACQYGKQSRIPFPIATWRAKKKLQLIHIDFKSEVASIFWKFTAKVENEYDCKIQT